MDPQSQSDARRFALLQSNNFAGPVSAASAASKLLLEDGASGLLLEDGTSYLLLEG